MEKIREFPSEVDWLWCFGCREPIRQDDLVALVKDKAGRFLNYHKACWDMKIQKSKKKLLKEPQIQYREGIMEGTDIFVSESVLRTLDNIKRIANNGIECWLARDLQELLGYSKWDNFKLAIVKARIACESAGAIPSRHFADIGKNIDDVALTRYACHLIAMNEDASKPEIAAVQNYFAIQGLKQGTAEQCNQTEDHLEPREKGLTIDGNNEIEETLYCPFCGQRLRKKGKLYLAKGYRQKYECIVCRRSTIRPVRQPPPSP